MGASGTTRVRALDPDIPIFLISTMTTFFHDRAMLGPRLIAQIVTATGVIGLLMTVIGLYGVVAYAVSRDARNRNPARGRRDARSRHAHGAESRRRFHCGRAGDRTGAGDSDCAQRFAQFCSGTNPFEAIVLFGARDSRRGHDGFVLDSRQARRQGGSDAGAPAGLAQRDAVGVDAPSETWAEGFCGAQYRLPPPNHLENFWVRTMPDPLFDHHQLDPPPHRPPSRRGLAVDPLCALARLVQFL